MPRWWMGSRPMYWVLVLGLALRLGAIVYLRDNALRYSSDSQAYQDIAVNLVERGRFITVIDPPHTLDKQYANRPPLTPWLLAGVYWLSGPNLLYGQILLAVIGVGACFLVFRLGSLFFGPVVGLWACFLAVINPLWILLAAVPMTESVALLLYPLFILWSYQLLKLPSARNALIAGLLLGLTALNKATVLGFAPLWAIWLVVALAPNWRKAVLPVGITAVVSGATLLPWTLRNYHQFGRVIPVTLQAGHSMFEANNPYTDYAMARVEHGETWLNDPRIYQPFTDLSKISQVQFDDSCRHLALRFIKENPNQFIRYALARVGVFWGAYASLPHRLYWFPVLLMFLLGVGLVWKLARGSRRELALPLTLILQTMSLVILFPSMPRYRVPIEPFVLVFAAYTVSPAFRGFQRLIGRKQEGADQ